MVLALIVGMPGYIELIILASIFLIGVVVFVGLFFLIKKNSQSPTVPIKSDQFVDLTKTPSFGPDANHAQLNFYSTPVRLAFLVIAPKGHSVQLPNSDQLQILIERVIPGLSKIVEQHQPTSIVWPAQMSVEGFSHALFHNIRLPGDDGRGSPWCGVAGHFTVGMGSMLIGLICVADSANQLSQVVVEHEGQWRDVLRVDDE